MSSEDLFAGLFDCPSDVEIPAFLTSHDAGGSDQVIEISDVSRRSQLSHTETEPSRNFDPNAPKISEVTRLGSRVEDTCVLGVGRAGSVGIGQESLAETTTCIFPSPSLLVGKKEGRWEEPDLPTGCTPIPPAIVRAAVERELQALAGDGREGPAALLDAVAITAAKIRNSEALAERQANGSRCHVCNGSLNDGMSVVAVLTGKRGTHLHMHDTCHAEHRVRRTALVDTIMTTAGYGPNQSDAAA